MSKWENKEIILFQNTLKSKPFSSCWSNSTPISSFTRGWIVSIFRVRRQTARALAKMGHGGIHHEQILTKHDWNQELDAIHQLQFCVFRADWKIKQIALFSVKLGNLQPLNENWWNLVGRKAETKYSRLGLGLADYWYIFYFLSATAGGGG